jgi:hypothetical protein
VGFVICAVRPCPDAIETDKGTHYRRSQVLFVSTETIAQEHRAQAGDIRIVEQREEEDQGKGRCDDGFRYQGMKVDHVGSLACQLAGPEQMLTSKAGHDSLADPWEKDAAQYHIEEPELPARAGSPGQP